ncbi:MAG: dihydroorotase, partial [Hyphomicrobium sp.]
MTTREPNGEKKRPLAFINARLIDPDSKRDEPGGLLVRDGLIADLGPHLRRNAPPGVDVVDCKGHVLCPGLIDAQVFAGEPGAEHRETLKTASHAAAAGGVTTIVVMPDTNPVIDQVALVDFIQRRARDNASVHVHTMAALTKGLKGEEMTEIGLLKRAGAIAFSNGKSSIANTRVMKNVLLYSKDFGALVVHHTEDPYLSANGAMNSGEVSSRLGLPGVSKTAETIVLERDVRLVEMTGGRYHAATITCAESLDVVRGAKKRRLPVTCGVSINHLTLNENDIGPYRTFFKVRPPLRREEDRVAMVGGIASGDIDIIVSSHDPQDADVKRRPFAEAADGAVGLETLLPAALRLHHSGELPLMVLLRAMTSNPAKLLGLHSGRLAKGAIAD